MNQHGGRQTGDAGDVRLGDAEASGTAAPTAAQTPTPAAGPDPATAALEAERKAARGSKQSGPHPKALKNFKNCKEPKGA